MHVINQVIQVRVEVCLPSTLDVLKIGVAFVIQKKPCRLRLTQSDGVEEWGAPALVRAVHLRSLFQQELHAIHVTLGGGTVHRWKEVQKQHPISEDISNWPSPGLEKCPSLWPSGIGSRVGWNRLWARFLAVSDIYPIFIEPTITWVPSGFSGYIGYGLTQKLCLKKCPRRAFNQFSVSVSNVDMTTRHF